jgi:hypothetical protein
MTASATATLADLSAARDPRGRFQPGCSGNPAGKQPGTRNRATLWRQAMVDGEAVKVARLIVDRAIAGDAAAARFLLQQIEIKPRQRPIKFDFPEGAGTAEMFEIVVDAMSKGEINASEAMQAWRVIEKLGWVRQADPTERRLDAAPDADLHSTSKMPTPGSERAARAPAPNRHLRRRARALARAATAPLPLVAAASAAAGLHSACTLPS